MTRIPITARDLRIGDVIDGDTVTHVKHLRCHYIVGTAARLDGTDSAFTYRPNQKINVRREGGR